MNQPQVPLPPPPPPPLRTFAFSLPAKPTPVSINLETDKRVVYSATVSDFDPSQDHSGNRQSNLGSDLFKEELIRKHSQLSNSTNLSIDERIKSSNNMTNKFNAESRGKDNSQVRNLPEKLLSTMQREKRPFAYSPDVNDPINRGKLDLNQIKSPEMRRRLLINMESSDDKDDDDIIVPFTTNYNSTIPKTLDFDGREVDEPRPAQPFYKQPQSTVPVVEEQTINYNERPIFYDTKFFNSSTSTSQNTDLHQHKDSTRLSEFDDLGLELTRSLDSLSQLASHLNSEEQRPRSQQTSRRTVTEMQTQPHYHLPQGMSTFLPQQSSSRVGKSSVENTQRFLKSSQPSKNKLVGDYLLSPDTNYFSVNSNSSPHSISPYYGSSLDGCDIENDVVNQSRKCTTSRTFSTTNQNQPLDVNVSNALNLSMDSIALDRTLDQLTYSLRKEVERIESEISRLNDIRRKRVQS